MTPTLAEQFREFLKRYPQATETDVGDLLAITRDVEAQSEEKALGVYLQAGKLSRRVERLQEQIRDLEKLKDELRDANGHLYGWVFALGVFVFGLAAALVWTLVTR